MLAGILEEIAGLSAFAVGIALMWLAWPRGGQAASFLRKSEVKEVAYALAITFLMAGGVGGILLGITG